MWLIDPSTHSGDSALETLAVLWTGSKTVRFGMGGVSPIIKMVTFCQQVDFVELRPPKSMAFCLVPPGLPSYLGVSRTATVLYSWQPPVLSQTLLFLNIFF